MSRQVSNKATFKNEAFLSKLSGTLLGRSAPTETTEAQPSTLKWHKTSEIKTRIKTATGTIALFSDTSQEEEEKIRESVMYVPPLGEESLPEDDDESDAASVALQTLSEKVSASAQALYIVTEDYSPDDDRGIALVVGQKVIVLDTSNPHKRARLETEEESSRQLLDNSAAKYKISIRPPKHHPDPRSRSPISQEERWLVRDADSGMEGLAPPTVLEMAPAGTAIATSIKRSLQEMSQEEGFEVKKKVMKEMIEIKKRSTTSEMLGPSPEEEAQAKRLGTTRELIETEEEFVKDLQFVMDNYYSAMDDPSTPKEIRDHKDVIFNNFNFIADFHKNVLIEGVKFNADVPKMIGKTFLRLERDFDKHAEYCSNEPLAQDYIENNENVRKFFEEYRKKIKDEKTLREHLKLPIQRLNDYQLLLKELVKYCSRLGEESEELEKSFELMQTIPQRATDAKFIASIEGFKGNLFKLGRLVRHDWFLVKETGHKARDRYVFLFKARILVTKVKKISDDRSVFILKEIIRLPETSLCGLQNPRVFELRHIEPHSHPNFPITLEARTPEIREAWLAVVKEHVVDTASVDDLLFDDEIRVISQDFEEEDQAFASPLPEGEEFEDLPRDEDQLVPGDYIPEDTKDIDIWFEDHVEVVTVPSAPEPPPPPPPAPKTATAAQQDQNDSAPQTKLKRVSSAELLAQIAKIKEKKESQKSDEEAKELSDKEESAKTGKEEDQKITVTTTEDIDYWTAEKESSIKTEEEVLQKEIEVSQKKIKFDEELIKETDTKVETEEFDFWTGRDASPAKTKTKVENLEEETDISYKKIKFDEEIIKESEIKVETKEEEFDFWTGQEKSPVKESIKKNEYTVSTVQKTEDFSILKEKLEETSETKDLKQIETTEEFDLWAAKDSSPVHTEKKSEDKLPDQTSKRPKEEESKDNIWTTRESSPPLKKRSQRTEAATLKQEILEQVEEITVTSNLAEQPKEKIVSEDKKQVISIEASEIGTESVEAESKKKSSLEAPIESQTQKTKKTELKLKSKEKVVQQIQEPVKEEPKVISTTDLEEEEKPKPKESQTKPGEEVPKKDLKKKKSEEAKKSEVEEPIKPATKKPKKSTDKEPAKVEETNTNIAHKEKAKEKKEVKVQDSKETGKSLQEDIKKTEVEEPAKPTPEKIKNSKVEEPKKSITKEKEKLKTEENKLPKLEEIKGPNLEEVQTPKLEEAKTPKLEETKKAKVDKSVPKDKKKSTIEEPKKSEETKKIKIEESQNLKVEDKSPKEEEKPKQSKPEQFVEKELKEKETPKVEEKKKPEKPSKKKEIKESKKEEIPNPSLAEKMDPTTPYTGVKPVFTKSITGDVVEPGEGATFVCEVSHPGSYYVTWLKDNMPLDDKLADRVQQKDEGAKHTLKLLNCRKEDSGIYTAKATDPNGATATCSAQLLVQEFTAEEKERRIAEKKPFFLVKMKATEVIENTNLSYAVHVKGSPMPIVEFFKDGKELKDDERITIHKDAEGGKYEILIKHVTKDDAGVYKCSAKNKFGEAECETDMTVTEEEEALMKLTGKGSLLKEGESADFKWFRDGVEFDPVERFNVMFKDEEDTLALVFQNVTPDDAGIYTCVASTSCGKISCSAELTVEGAINRLMRNPVKPSFPAPLEDTSVMLYGTAMLDCKVDGYPKPELTWSHEGKDIELGGRYKQLWEDEESVTLVIKSINEEDKGTYTLKAKNELGEDECKCNLIIKSGPKFKKLDKIVGCNIGQPLSCVVECDGTPIPTVQWLKNGKEMFPDKHVSFESTPDGKYTLKIDKIKPDDCTYYTIIATNEMGQRSEQFQMEADTPPEITRGLDSETERKFQTDHTFEVRAKGSPAPTAKWYKDGKEIYDDGSHFIMTVDEQFYMLKICNISIHDKGLYKIVLSNNSGKAESEGTLKVRGPPRFTKPMEDGCAKEGAKQIKLYAEWDSNPRPTVTWYFNDKTVHEDTPGVTVKIEDNRTEILIHEAVKEVCGRYSIKLSNEYGDATSKARFRLHEAPKLLEPLQDIEFLENTTCKYICKVSGVPVPEINWMKDGSKFTPDGKRVKIQKGDEEEYMIFIEDALTEDSGKYSATISNVEGSVSTEGSVIVNTPPHILGSNFREGLTFIAMHKFVLEVEATAVPEAEATWLCNGKELNEEEDSVKFTFDGKFYRMERIGSDPEQSGEYICRLTNKITSVDETGQISIIEKESRVRRPLKPLFIKEYNDASIECQIVGDPYPSVQWYRDGKLIENNERYEITEDEKGYRKVLFKDVREKDKSTFKCVGKNEHGDCETSCLVTVHVVPQPGELQDIVVDWGRDLLLSVNIHAIPTPAMCWYQDGKELVESDRIIYLRDEKTEVYSLKVKAVGLEDAGKYTYKATNCVGDCNGASVVKIHTEKPSIVEHVNDVDVCLEDEISFFVKTIGLPQPEVKWLNKGVVVDNAERYTTERIQKDEFQITLKDLQLQDYGEIMAVSTNLVGEARSNCQLRQKKLPCEILKELDVTTTCKEGKDVKLTALIRASPRPKFYWTKDGDRIEGGDKYKMKFEKTTYRDAKISVTIYETENIDAGQYRLHISNDVNDATTETALVVIASRSKPIISSKPQELSVAVNEPGIFKCKIKGFPIPDVKWLKDGREVRPTDLINFGRTADGVFYLDFKNITDDDAGKYTVVATNDEGTTQFDTYLTVNPKPSKPEFLQKLEATKVIEEYPCRLEVKLAGHPKPKVAWTKNGRPIEVDGTHFKEHYLDDGTVILQMDKAAASDAGEYGVIATNELGNMSSSAPLTVLGHEREDGQPDGEPTFTEGLKDGSFDEGKTIKLPVAVRGGPVPDMKWYKNGKEIKIDGRTFFTYDGDKTYLEIRPCQASDSGTYKCVIENDHGKAETECNVTVRKCFEPPSFYQMFPGQQQLPGKDAKFSVKVDGAPRPEITWFFNNKPIALDGDKYRLRKDPDGCTLYIRDCTYSDTGTIKCVAKNRVGQVEHQAKLEVSDSVDPSRKTEPPVFLKVIGDQELYENFTAKFKAVVSGRPTPQYEWYKDGVPIYPNNRIISERDEEGLIRLTIKHVCAQDSGLYELKIWNTHGEAKCKGKLYCECISKDKKRPVGDEYKGFDKIRETGAPIPLSEPPLISALSDRRATLSWAPHVPVGLMPPATYQVEMCEVPEGDWVTAHTGIRGCSVDLTNLIPKSDYRFRVRVENKFGVSEPSPYAQTHRTRLERLPDSHEPMLDEEEFDPSYKGPYVPPGFEIRCDDRGRFSAPPRFLRLDYDTQYGMKNFNARVKWIVYGYPMPKLKFYFKDEEINFVKKTQYTFKQELNGEVFLFVDKMVESDVGWYKCVAYNEYGESQQRIRLCLCEYPKVIEHLKETHMRAHTSGKIYCRISAYPPCDVTWYKDWQEIKPHMNLKSVFIEPDIYCLDFHTPTLKDSGLYSIAAVNVAGSVSSSGMVRVEEDDSNFNWCGPGKGRLVGLNARPGCAEDHYDIGDEIGRGTQSVVYHIVEHHSGRNFAGKAMWGLGHLRDWMRYEFEMMNLLNSSRHIVRMFDAYEGHKNFVIIEELCGGGSILSQITQREYIIESEVAFYVRQILEGVDYIHERGIAHCGLSIGDILVTRPNGFDIKIGDLSLARHIRSQKLLPLEYGMPEFVAPETALGEGIGYGVDMWGVGVITYLLLSGISPFRGEHDRETLNRVKKGELRFDKDAFKHISVEAKDFISKLLQFKADKRMSVKEALRHNWLHLSELPVHDPHKIYTDRHRSYYEKYKDWYRNASCRHWYRRNTLETAYSHPSKMVYPPYDVYTPPQTPVRERSPAPVEDYEIPYRDLSYEVEDFRNDSNYQCGPDTYLLQLRDPDFPARLRRYMKLASKRDTPFSPSNREYTYDYNQIPIVYERRRFTDVMDEELADEKRRTKIDRYTVGFVRSAADSCSLDVPKRIKHELSSRYVRQELYESHEEKSKGRAPFIREKPETTAIAHGVPLTLNCCATGNPEPIIQWFKNDVILGDTARCSVTTKDGRSQFNISECRDFDAGQYKVVARNSVGQAVHRFRLVVGSIPGVCDPPEADQVSGTQILLRWRPPIDDGGSTTECYRLQMRVKGDDDWTELSDSIEQELYLVEGLKLNGLYQFRIGAKNCKGWSEFSVASIFFRTTSSREDKVVIPAEQEFLSKQPKLHVLQLPGARGEIRDLLDYSREIQHVPLKTGEPAELQIKKYKMISEISRGQFSLVMRCQRQDDQRTFACKILQRGDREEKVKHEYEVMKSLRHEKLITLYESYHLPQVTVFMMEFLSGVDALTFLASKLEYSEQTVTTIINQILDGISYLHWRGLCHLDLQPDNIVITSPRKADIKLIDFGSTRKVEPNGTKVPQSGSLDFIAPEVLSEGKAYPNTDIWSVGSLTYLFLKGTTPFVGEDDEETKANTEFVRYRYEELGTKVSQEATRFIMLIFKRDPSKRPAVDECREHRWLIESDFMTRKRERAVISPGRLREYALAYHNAKRRKGSKSSEFKPFTSQC